MNFNKVKYSPVTIGADPEMFLQDTTGKFISSIGLFGGTKEKPRPLKNVGFFVQEDNVAVEFNIPPDSRRKVFINNIQYAIKEIEKEIKSRHLKLAIVPSAHFELDQLNNPKAREFGCNEDLNVWTMSANPRPKAKDKTLRSAGGHVHIASKNDSIGLGRAMDLFAGVPSVLFDQDKERRELYGKAGAIRIKPYGIEYRTLSNFWIKSQELIDKVFTQVIQAIHFVADKKQSIPREDAIKIIKCINNSDPSFVPELTEKYGLKY